MIRTGKGLRMGKAQAIRLLISKRWTVRNMLSGRQSAVLVSPDGVDWHGDPRDLLDELAHQAGRRNIDTIHAASDREFVDSNEFKYGTAPWGQFYHYLALELAKVATAEQTKAAIDAALHCTEHQETGLRNDREKRARKML